MSEPFEDRQLHMPDDRAVWRRDEGTHRHELRVAPIELQKRQGHRRFGTPTHYRVDRPTLRSDGGRLAAKRETQHVPLQSMRPQVRVAQLWHVRQIPFAIVAAVSIASNIPRRPILRQPLAEERKVSVLSFVEVELHLGVLVPQWVERSIGRTSRADGRT